MDSPWQRSLSFEAVWQLALGPDAFLLLGSLSPQEAQEVQLHPLFAKHVEGDCAQKDEALDHLLDVGADTHDGHTVVQDAMIIAPISVPPTVPMPP